MGGYHTLDLELNRSFTLTKITWDLISLQRIELATDPSKTADMGAIILQEGLANVCLITPHMTLVKARIEVHVPRKRRGGGGEDRHAKGLDRFYESVGQAIEKWIDYERVKVLIIASPGFYKVAMTAI